MPKIYIILSEGSVPGWCWCEWRWATFDWARSGWPHSPTSEAAFEAADSSFHRQPAAGSPTPWRRLGRTCGECLTSGQRHALMQAGAQVVWFVKSEGKAPTKSLSLSIPERSSALARKRAEEGSAPSFAQERVQDHGLSTSRLAIACGGRLHPRSASAPRPMPTPADGERRALRDRLTKPAGF